MGGVFSVAEHFNISPADILTKWSYPIFIDSIERLSVLNEIESRKAKLMEQ